MRARRQHTASMLLALLAVFALIAAACGDDSDSAGETDAPVGTDEPAGDEPVDDEPVDDEPADDEPVEDEPDVECTGGATAPGVTETEIKVAIVTTLSGNSAAGHGDFDKGFEAYMEALNDRGGVCGRTVDIVAVYDDEGDGTLQQQFYEQSVESDGAFAVAGSWPNFGAAEYGDVQRIPTVGAAYSAGMDYSEAFFGVPTGTWRARDINDLPPVPDSTQAVDAYVMAKIGAETAYTFGYSLAASADTAREVCGFIDTFAGEGACVDADVTADFGFQDVGASSATIANEEIKYISAAMDLAGCVQIVRDLKRNGVDDFTLRCAVGVGVDGAFDDYGDDLENIVVSLMNAPIFSSIPAMEEFRTELDERKPGVAPSTTSLNGWMAAMLFEDVLQLQGADLTREGFIETGRSDEMFSSWDANGLMPAVDWTTNRWEAIEAGTFAPNPDLCVGEIWRPDVAQEEWVKVGPDGLLCLQTFTSPEEVLAYAEGGDGGGSIEIGG